MTKRRILETAGWWVILTALFMMLPSTIDTTEVAGAIVAGGVASLIGARATKGMRPALPPRHLPYWRLLLLPADVARDTVTLLRHLGDRSGGRREELVLPPAGTPAGMRSAAVLAVSASPGSYVLDVLVDEGEPDRIVVHRTFGGGAGLVEPMVTVQGAPGDEGEDAR